MQKNNNDPLLSTESALHVLTYENQLIKQIRPQTTLSKTRVPLITDSRHVVEGSIYLTFKGVSKDGHDFLADVVNKKPALLIIEDEAQVPHHTSCPVLIVPNGRRAWALLCAAAYGNPEKNLKFIGVTGTNGKTSTVWHMKHLLSARGKKVLSLGTLGAYLGDQLVPTTHTTPDPPFLYQMLHEAKESNATTVVMETSSHALHQEKLAPLSFNGCVFTSFTRDHLDLHGSMEEYFHEKKRLFTERARPDAFMLFSASLEGHLNDLRDFASKGTIYGFHAKASAARYHFKSYADLTLVKVHAKGSTCRVETPTEELTLEIPLLGSFALENFLAAKLAVEALTKQAVTQDELKFLKQVPGRLDLIDRENTKAPMVLVDYAHTPDALEKALQVLKDIPHKTLWVVFGCGGDRDVGKRPLMGAIAISLADQIIVTSDNPRKEDPLRIIHDIMNGVPNTESHRVQTIADRAIAIKTAINQAGVNDIVLIAGKGHEDYMEIQGERIHFSDHEHARQAMKG